MNRQKLYAAALVLPLFGGFLLLSPLIDLFTVNVTVAGLPLEVVYIFLVWLGLIVAAYVLARALGQNSSLYDSADQDLGEDSPP
jgi:hypothetical protein